MSLIHQTPRTASAPTSDRRSYRFDFNFSLGSEVAKQNRPSEHEYSRLLDQAIEIIEALQTRCDVAESDAKQSDLERCRIAVTATHEIKKRDLQISAARRENSELEDALFAMARRVAEMSKCHRNELFIEARTIDRSPSSVAPSNGNVSIKLLSVAPSRLE